jgi:hypothetical protein
VRVNEQIARCFSHLRAPEFTHLVEFFRAERQETLEKLAQVTDEKLVYRLQGEAAKLKEILEYIESAEALIAKMKRQ